MADVFISYKREDRPFVAGLAGCLGALGLTVWYDQDLEPGRSWRDELVRELAGAGVVLAVWSNAATQSRNVVAEATIADARDALISAVIEPCEPPYPFARLPSIDLVPLRASHDDASFWRLVDFIGEKIGNSALRSMAHSRLDAAPSLLKPAAFVDYDEMMEICDEVRDAVRSFDPDVLIAFAPRPGFWAEKLFDLLQQRIPVVVGFRPDTDDPVAPAGYVPLKSAAGRTIALLPAILRSLPRGTRLLLVTDWSPGLADETAFARYFCEDLGWPRDSVRAVSLLGAVDANGAVTVGREVVSGSVRLFYDRGVIATFARTSAPVGTSRLAPIQSVTLIAHEGDRELASQVFDCLQQAEIGLPLRSLTCGPSRPSLTHEPSLQATIAIIVWSEQSASWDGDLAYPGWVPSDVLALHDQDRLLSVTSKRASLPLRLGASQAFDHAALVEVPPTRQRLLFLGALYDRIGDLGRRSRIDMQLRALPASDRPPDKLRRRIFSFRELVAITARLRAEVQQFAPDAILSFDARGGLWAEFLAESLKSTPPVITGFRLKRTGPRRASVCFDECQVLTTPRWQLFIPPALSQLSRDARVLFVDDYSLSGETCRLTKDFLIKDGFGEDRVRTLVLISAPAGVGAKPDFCGEVTEEAYARPFYMYRR